MAELTVRLGRPGEELAIAKVHVETWQTAYRGIVPDDFLDAMDVALRARNYSDDMLTDPDRPMWVAERERIVGFTGAGPSRDADGEGELYAIYIDASEWGRGTGDVLMVAALDHLRPRFDAATLWVLESERSRAKVLREVRMVLRRHRRRLRVRRFRDPGSPLPDRSHVRRSSRSAQ